MTPPPRSAPARRRTLSSVANALRVLAYLGDTGDAGVSEISRQVHVTVGTAHRLVGTLVSTGWAEQDPDTRKYRLSQKIVELAEKKRATLDARAIAHQHLADLVQRVNETGNLAILDESRRVLYVDKVTSEQPFGVEARVGSRLPFYCTALGKALVAGLDDAQRAGYLRSLSRGARSKDTNAHVDLAAFRADIEAVRTKGYALDLGEYLPDVYCAAAPIYGKDGTTVAAVSVSVPRSRFLEQQQVLTDEVRTTAATLSDALREVGLPASSHDFVPPGLGS